MCTLCFIESSFLSYINAAFMLTTSSWFPIDAYYFANCFNLSLTVSDGCAALDGVLFDSVAADVEVGSEAAGSLGESRTGKILSREDGLVDEGIGLPPSGLLMDNGRTVVSCEVTLAGVCCLTF